MDIVDAIKELVRNITDLSRRLERIETIETDVLKADTITKTVKATGGDFTTIQGAIDFFANKICTACVIEVDAGLYAETLVVDDLITDNPAGLTIRGDTRLLAGASYVDGHYFATTGGGFTPTNGGKGTIALSSLGAVVTVTGSVTNPDFDADGWGAGDKVVIRGDATNPTEYTILSVLNNTITLTVAAPAVGADGTSITLLPNRRVTSAAKVFSSFSNCTLTGFTLEATATGTGSVVSNNNTLVINKCAGLVPTGNTGQIILANFAGFVHVGSYSSGVYSFDGTVSAIQMGALVGTTSTAFMAGSTPAIMQAYHTAAINCYYGYRVSQNTRISSRFCVAAICTYGYYNVYNSFAYHDGSYARLCSTGYYAGYNAHTLANSTNAKNSSATPYSPAVTDTEGNVFGIITFS